jgi:hypothetical protein
MVHEREGLPFRFEAGDDLASTNAGADELERDLAADGSKWYGPITAGGAASTPGAVPSECGDVGKVSAIGNAL